MRKVIAVCVYDSNNYKILNFTYSYRNEYSLAEKTDIPAIWNGNYNSGFTSFLEMYDCLLAILKENKKYVGYNYNLAGFKVYDIMFIDINNPGVIDRFAYA